ncbi:hypothetical protein ACWGPD_11980 [Streptomyces hirsutus]|uniref:hypothetical protein n=1 Tax=Streptomyces hirsutus TaxID=35620 RepID=UPI00362C68EA
MIEDWSNHDLKSMRELSADFLNRQVAIPATSQDDVPHGHGTTAEDFEGPQNPEDPSGDKSAPSLVN